MGDLTTIDDDTGEVIAAPITSLPGLDIAEIDRQIATARAFPRSINQVANEIFSLVTRDEESAEECVYALPRGGKPITGPSIRFAEALKQSFGNCRSAARVVEVNRLDKYVEAEGVFFDVQKNTATSSRVRRRIVDKHGRLFNDDMIIVTGNAACAIAMRNAILGGIPKPIWRAAYAEANRVISGDVTTLSVNREKAMKAFAAFGVKPEQIYQALGIAGGEDITVQHIGILRGMHSALKNQESTVEEMFAPPVAEKKTDPDYNPLAGGPTKPKAAKKPIGKEEQQPADTGATEQAPAEPGATASEKEPEREPGDDQEDDLLGADPDGDA